MKFLIIGSSAPHASEASYARLLRERGHEAVIWDNKAPSALFGGRSWWRLSWAQKIAYDALASYRCYRFCCKHQPDVLFLPKAENIRAYAIRKIQEQTGARLVMWYPDHPLKVNQTSMNVIRNLARCDIFYIWGRFLVEPIRSAGCRRVEYLPFGFDPVLHDPAIEPTAEERARYACDICFVGTWDEARERALEPLADFSLGIWGPQWGERVSETSPLRRHIRGGGLYGAEMVKAFKSARVVFNHLRRHNGPAHNVRTMEATGIGGGVLLVRRTPEQARTLFVEGEHVACYDSPEELRAVAAALLADDARSARMSAAAQQKTLQEHLLEARIRTILRDLEGHGQ